MAAAQDHAALADHRPGALPLGQGRPLFDAVEWRFRSPPKYREHRRVGEPVDGVVAPLAGRDHLAVKSKQPVELASLEEGDGSTGERRRIEGHALRNLVTDAANGERPARNTFAKHESTLTLGPEKTLFRPSTRLLRPRCMHRRLIGKPCWSRILNSPPSPPGSWGPVSRYYSPSKSPPWSPPDRGGLAFRGLALFARYDFASASTPRIRPPSLAWTRTSVRSPSCGADGRRISTGRPPHAPSRANCTTTLRSVTVWPRL